MINNIRLETEKYINSAEYDKAVTTLANFYEMNDDQVGILFGRINLLLLGGIKEEGFVWELASRLDIPEAKARSIEDRVKKEVIAPFKQKLVALLSGMPNVDTTAQPKTLDGFPASIETLRQQSQVPQQPQQPQQPKQPSSPFPIQKTAPQPRTEEPMTKEHILAQIENPPRTVIKKYVIEHEPIKDPDHLIQDHYND